jgi:hypothetical protein
MWERTGSTPSPLPLVRLPIASPRAQLTPNPSTLITHTQPAKVRREEGDWGMPPGCHPVATLLRTPHEQWGCQVSYGLPVPRSGPERLPSCATRRSGLVSVLMLDTGMQRQRPS